MIQGAYPSHEDLVESRRPAPRYAVSVTGLVREDKMGVVLPHEHILLDLRSYHEGDMALYEEICMGLSARGVQPDADGREPWFLSYSHSEADIADTLTVFEEAVREAQK